jgi:hypothetical protein
MEMSPQEEQMGDLDEVEESVELIAYDQKYQLMRSINKARQKSVDMHSVRSPESYSSKMDTPQI